MNEDKMLDILEKYIKDNELKIPSLEGQAFQKVMNDIVSNEQIFAQLLTLVSSLVKGRHIILMDEVAQASVKYKIQKKAFLLNIILDILFYLEFITYEKITENFILIKIVNEDMANELNNMRIKMKEHSKEFCDMAEAMDKALDNNEKYQEIKRDLQ